MGAVDVTVIVPTFNRAGYVAETLGSILAQSMPPREVIVVDDGSTDDTPAVLAGLGSRITVVRQANAGKAAALNRAVAGAQGEAVWIVDDDDIVEPDALARLSQALGRTPEAGFAFGNYDHFTVDERGRRRHFAAPLPPSFSTDDLYFGLMMWCFVFQPAMLVRRQAYAAVGEFDEQNKRSEDYDMLLRLARAFRAVHVDSIVFHQRQHPGPRGPWQVVGSELQRRQEQADATVFARAVHATALVEYLPWSQRDAVDQPAFRAKALLRRAAFATRRRDWAAAAEDVRALTELEDPATFQPLPQDVVALFSPGLRRTPMDQLQPAKNPLLDKVLALPAGPLRHALLSTLLEPVSRTGLKAAFGRDWTRAARHLGLCMRLAGPWLLAEHVRRFAGDFVGHRTGLPLGPSPSQRWLAPA